jgi:hypothetical protein
MYYYLNTPPTPEKNLVFLPIIFVADTETFTGRHRLGVGLEMIGRQTLPALYLPDRSIGSPVMSSTSTLRLSTAKPV